MDIKHISIDCIYESLAEILQSFRRTHFQQMINQWMLETVSRSFGRHWRRHYNRNSVAGTAVFLRLQMHGNYTDIIIGSTSDEIDASLHQFVNQITENLALGFVRSRHAH